MIVFLTYGEGNDKFMASDHSFCIKDVVNALQPDKMKELTGKAKIIMVNASRGNKLNQSVRFNESAAVTAAETSTGTSSTESKISTSVAYNLENYSLYDKDIGCGYSGHYPLNADFLLCYSTFESKKYQIPCFNQKTKFFKKKKHFQIIYRFVMSMVRGLFKNFVMFLT